MGEVPALAVPAVLVLPFPAVLVLPLPATLEALPAEPLDSS